MTRAGGCAARFYDSVMLMNKYNRLGLCLYATISSQITIHNLLMNIICGLRNILCTHVDYFEEKECIHQKLSYRRTGGYRGYESGA